MNTFSETELLLRTAINLSDNSVKQIAAASGIKASTLYKFHSSKVHLSPAKSDTLLLYFIEKEPKAIVAASVLNYVLNILYVYLTSLSEQEVSEEE